MQSDDTVEDENDEDERPMRFSRSAAPSPEFSEAPVFPPPFNLGAPVIGYIGMPLPSSSAVPSFTIVPPGETGPRKIAPLRRSVTVSLTTPASLSKPAPVSFEAADWDMEDQLDWGDSYDDDEEIAISRKSPGSTLHDESYMDGVVSTSFPTSDCRSEEASSTVEFEMMTASQVDQIVPPPSASQYGSREPEKGLAASMWSTASRESQPSRGLASSVWSEERQRSSDRSLSSSMWSAASSSSATSAEGLNHPDWPFDKREVRPLPARSPEDKKKKSRRGKGKGQKRVDDERLETRYPFSTSMTMSVSMKRVMES